MQVGRAVEEGISPDAAGAEAELVRTAVDAVAIIEDSISVASLEDSFDHVVAHVEDGRATAAVADEALTVRIREIGAIVAQGCVQGNAGQDDKLRLNGGRAHEVVDEGVVRGRRSTKLAERLIIDGYVALDCVR